MLLKYRVNLYFSMVDPGLLLDGAGFGKDERKFLEPLMRFTRGDVRGHIG